MKEKVLYSLKQTVKHYEGLNVRNGASVIVRLTNYNLQICDVKKKPIFNISLKDIINVAIISDKEIIEKDKSVIGRGIVGNVLFGGAGLILGGLSGLNKKQVVQNVDYLIINYKENGEDKVVSLYANEGIINNGFIKWVNKLIDMSKQDIKCPYCNSDIKYIDVICPKCGKRVRGEKELKMLKWIFVGIIAFVIFIVIIAMTVGSDSNSSNGGSKDVNIIKRVANIEEEKAENVDNILSSIGLESIEDMKADSEGLDGFEGDGSKGYRIKTSFSDNVILYLDSNDNVICVRYADKDYYRNGNVLNKFE